MFTRKLRTGLVACLLALAVTGLAACGSSSKGSSSTASAGAGSGSTSGSGGSNTGFKPINSGQLTTGMNLQFKPEMYLNSGQPAGYDVDLLKQLAPDLGAKLNIKNLDFNGLIPGLQANQFDLVSVGLSATPERQKVVDFTRGYVPYAQTLGVPASKAASITSAQMLNKPGVKITALQGSTGEQLARKDFPKATVQTFPDQNATFLQVATGRADAVVVEDYLLAQFNASNPGKLAEAKIPRPLDVQYGSWAVPKGHSAFVKYLNTWLCKKQKDGTLASIYKRDFQVATMPPMPAC
jgi:ABC-type amino acid transport substrate-binding protein